MPLSRAASAQQGRNVRLVVPAAPGGAIDAIGRLYAERLKDMLGQTWVVENRAGANNTLGAAEVARAAPDGSTLLTNADIHLMAKHVMKHVPYDPVADFTPISRFATSPMVFVGHPGKTPADLKALAAEMKATPDKHTFSNSALGAMGHLATESFNNRIGVKTVIVSYRGTAPALTDVIGGQTTLMVAPLGSALQQIQAGSLRAFAVMSERRSPQLPAVPTSPRPDSRAELPALVCAVGPEGHGARPRRPDQCRRADGLQESRPRAEADGARRRAGDRDGRRVRSLLRRGGDAQRRTRPRCRHPATGQLRGS